MSRGEKLYFSVWDYIEEIDDFLSGNSWPELSESRILIFLAGKCVFY